MPEINHEHLDPAIAEAAREFCTEEYYEGGSVTLTGPNLLHLYDEPMVGVAQGALFSFNAGDRPRMVMLVERLGDRLMLHLARITREKIVIYHKGQRFTDLENNYMEQPL
jgi:hypothetical protein